MEDMWLISIVSLLIGAVIGFLMGRSGNTSNRQAELAEQLENANKELESYKEEVSQHFEKTASLVNNLTNSYKDVHEHLATGAVDLCKAGTLDLALEPVVHEKLENKEVDTEEVPAAVDDTKVDIPRDYAPKSPEEEGTLSETFGLKEEPLNEDADSDENSNADTTKKAPLVDEKK